MKRKKKDPFKQGSATSACHSFLPEILPTRSAKALFKPAVDNYKIGQSQQRPKRRSLLTYIHTGRKAAFKGLRVPGFTLYSLLTSEKKLVGPVTKLHFEVSADCFLVHYLNMTKFFIGNFFKNGVTFLLDPNSGRGDQNKSIYSCP